MCIDCRVAARKIHVAVYTRWLAGWGIRAEAIGAIESPELRFSPNPLILCPMSSAFHSTAHLYASSPTGLLLYLLR